MGNCEGCDLHGIDKSAEIRPYMKNKKSKLNKKTNNFLSVKENINIIKKNRKKRVSFFINKKIISVDDNKQKTGINFDIEEIQNLQKIKNIYNTEVQNFESSEESEKSEESENSDYSQNLENVTNIDVDNKGNLNYINKIIKKVSRNLKEE